MRRDGVDEERSPRLAGVADKALDPQQRFGLVRGDAPAILQRRAQQADVDIGDGLLSMARMTRVEMRLFFMAFAFPITPRRGADLLKAVFGRANEWG